MLPPSAGWLWKKVKTLIAGLSEMSGSFYQATGITLQNAVFIVVPVCKNLIFHEFNIPSMAVGWRL